MDDLKIKANESQEKLAELQKQRGLIGGDETDNIVTEKLKGIDEQLTSAEVGPHREGGALPHRRIRQSGADRVHGSRADAAGLALAAGGIARRVRSLEHQVWCRLSEAGRTRQPDDAGGERDRSPN